MAEIINGLCRDTTLKKVISMYTCQTLVTNKSSIKSSFLQAHYLDPTRHYLRLKFLMENQEKIYIPKPDEDVCDLVWCSLFRLNVSGFYMLNNHRKTQYVTL